MQQSFWPILCANKKPYHRDYWDAVTVGLFSSFRHKPFLTEKTASLASAVHTFIVLSNFISTPLTRYAVSTITPSPLLIVQKQIAGQIKAEDGWVDCSLQQPNLEVPQSLLCRPRPHMGDASLRRSWLKRKQRGRGEREKKSKFNRWLPVNETAETLAVVYLLLRCMTRRMSHCTTNGQMTAKAKLVGEMSKGHQEGFWTNTINEQLTLGNVMCLHEYSF